MSSKNLLSIPTLNPALSISLWLLTLGGHLTSAQEESDRPQVQLTDGAFADEPDVDESMTATSNWFSQHGINPYVTFTGELLGNTTGGFDSGSAWAGLIDVGIDLSLKELVDWKGGGFFVNAFYFHGNDLNGDYVGNFNGVSNIYTDTDFNVFNIYLTQTFADGRYWAKAGQIASDDDFMIIDSAVVFLNPAFVPSPVQTGNTTAPIYPLAAPGVFVYTEPLDGVYFQTAIYAGDAGPNQPNNHGFQWRLGGSAGYAWFAESGYHYDLFGKGTFKAGGFYSTGDFANFSSGSTERGLGGMYAFIDHKFIDSNAFGFSVFFGGSITPDSDVATVNSSIAGGLNLSGIWLEEDVVGFGFVYTDFASSYLSATRASGTAVTSTETIIELSYQAKVTDWLAVQPDLQYTIDPHFSGRNSLVVGIRIELSFN